MKNKAVILGANYYIGLSTIRCLGKNGVVVAAVDYSDNGAYGFRSKYCSEKLIGPHYKENSKAFLEFLIDYAKKQDASPVLIPCADPYVEFVDTYLYELKEYFLIPQTKKGLYTELMNKEKLHSLASLMNVKVPETIRLTEDNYIEKIETILKYPCIVKPVDSPAFVSTFRRKMFKVNDRKELVEAIDKAKKAGLEVIVQRIIPGFDDHMYTFDAYLNQEAKVTNWLTCQKYRQYPINFGASVYTGQKYVQELYDIGAKFLEGVGFKGFAEIEFKKDAVTGDFYLIEVNVRITNLNSLLEKVGVNMPYLTYMELTGEKIEPQEIKKDTGLVFWYAYEDFLASRGYVKTKQLKTSEIIKSLFRPKAYAIWDVSDSKPFFEFNGILMKKVFRKLFK
ncbi:putative ATP-grasp superfamily ATP-dependent carboligase [Acetoanaerobium pronyense]|uniref:ATP-grasp superfamily ATP-dependent carboligase n=1 Tax=Acetoanaerobium pronyense TaxID=1482736 RepID=A0ABS4KJ54_9FIRM|nr:carboxylate--amine ligase [Acetoanaerobium pronyense]MBP2027828.1 putative ATP-grasp superfamily ATP-dependent carboligase [Acetoanaerobium pronyense]